MTAVAMVAPPASIAAATRALAACSCTSDDVRILRRVSVCEGATGAGGPSVGTGVVVDVETLGVLDADPIIELAARAFRYDADGVVTRIGRLRSWREDPGLPVPPEITELTGLADADLAGRRIDDDEVAAVLRSADFVCAHNAAFDRPRIERRLPGLGGLRWACSMADVRWREHRIEGRRLGDLLAQVGFFHEGHRAGADVDAVFALLRHRLPDGGTALAAMLADASATSWVVTAVGAPFATKDVLKGRGYRWDAVQKAWWRELRDDQREAEEWWQAREVYAGCGGGPRWATRDWTTRHG